MIYEFMLCQWSESILINAVITKNNRRNGCNGVLSLFPFCILIICISGVIFKKDKYIYRT